MLERVIKSTIVDYLLTSHLRSSRLYGFLQSHPYFIRHFDRLKSLTNTANLGMAFAGVYLDWLRPLTVFLTCTWRWPNG